MPMRTITLDDGGERTRRIVNIHPDGTEFQPEEFALPADTTEGERIYRSLERLIHSEGES